MSKSLQEMLQKKNKNLRPRISVYEINKDTGSFKKVRTSLYKKSELPIETLDYVYTLTIPPLKGGKADVEAVMSRQFEKGGTGLNEKKDNMSGGSNYDVKKSKQGYIKEIRQAGKKVKEITVLGKVYNFNSIYKTYNSVSGNELLHISDWEKQFEKGGSTDASKADAIIKKYSGNIKSKEVIEGFIGDLFNKLELNFHPDDPFEDYEYENKALFTSAQAKALNKIMDDCFEFANKHNIDVYEISVEQFNHHVGTFAAGGEVGDKSFKEQLDIEDVKQFGSKYRDWINLASARVLKKFGRYVGYYIDFKDRVIHLLFEKGVEDYSFDGKFKSVSNREVHYEEGGQLTDQKRLLPDEYYQEFTLKGNGTRKYNIFQPHTRLQLKQAARKLFPDMKYEEHLQRAKDYSKKALDAQSEYIKAVDQAFMNKFGRKSNLTDYKVAGIWSNELMDEDKEIIRKFLREHREYKDALELHNSMLRQADQQARGNYEAGGEVNDMPIEQRIDIALDSYIYAGLFTSTNPDNEEEEFLNTNYSKSDIAPHIVDKMRADVKRFYEENIDLINESGMGDDQIGNDFWLTREHHGAGFWDKGLGDVGDKLTEAAQKYPETYLYIGDDGKIYADGGGYEKGGPVGEKDRAFETSNLYLTGEGLDTNGNHVIRITFPNSRGFSIQTNGNLPHSNRILKSVERISEITDEDMKVIEKEVNSYVKEFGSKQQKSRLKIYGGSDDKKMSVGGKLPGNYQMNNQILTPHDIFSKNQILTLDIYKTLIGQKIATTAVVGKGNSPHVNVFTVGDLVLHSEESYLLMDKENENSWHWLHMNNKHFDQPTFTDSDANRAVYYMVIKKKSDEEGTNVIKSEKVIKQDDVPENIYWNLYEFDSRLVDSDICVEKQGNSFFITSGLGGRLIVEKDLGERESAIWNYLNDLFNSKSSGETKFSKGGEFTAKQGKEFVQGVITKYKGKIDSRKKMDAFLNILINDLELPVKELDFGISKILGKDKKPLFGLVQATALNKILRECFVFANSNAIDIYSAAEKLKRTDIYTVSVKDKDGESVDYMPLTGTIFYDEQEAIDAIRDYLKDEDNKDDEALINYGEYEVGTGDILGDIYLSLPVTLEDDPDVKQ